MTPRSSTLAASALLLVAGCSGPSTIEAHRPGASAAPAVAAAGPRNPAHQVVFAPAIPPALGPWTPASTRRAPVLTVGSGDEEDLPPVTVPDGWVPAAEPSSREVLGLDDVEFAEDPGPEEAGYEGEQDIFDESFEEVVIEEVLYSETIEIETETIEIGTPILVVQGYSSWAYGRFPAVCSSRRFDPCFSPPHGAAWAPVDFDPCWDACSDPAWGTWNRVCDERNRRGHVGPEVVEDRGGPTPPKAPKPHRDPVVREDPPAAPPPAPDPARTGRRGHTVLTIPTAPAPRPDPVARPSRQAPAGRSQGPDQEPSEPAARAPAARTARAHAAAWPPVPESAPVPDEPTEEPAAVVRHSRPSPEPRPDRSPRSRSTANDDAPAAAPAPAPTPRAERAQVRDRQEAPRPEPRAEPAREARHAESPRPEPAREPAHGRNGGGHDRTPEVQAPPPPPPPPPAPQRNGGGGRHR